MNQYLMEILVCPKSGGKLIYSKETNELVCYDSMLAYPIENEIPIMLIDRARTMKESEKNKYG